MFLRGRSTYLEYETRANTAAVTQTYLRVRACTYSHGLALCEKQDHRGGWRTCVVVWEDLKGRVGNYFQQHFLYMLFEMVFTPQQQ